MAFHSRHKSLSPEEFRRAIDALADRSEEELLAAQRRLASLRPLRLVA